MVFWKLYKQCALYYYNVHVIQELHVIQRVLPKAAQPCALYAGCMLYTGYVLILITTGVMISMEIPAAIHIKLELLYLWRF